MRASLFVLSAAVMLAAAPAWAGPDQADPRVTELLDQARRVYGVSDPRDRCRRRDGQEIVVCVDHGDDLHVPSTAESDPNSREAQRALNNGIPRAPQFDRGSCKGQPGCVTGGWAPPPIYEIDVSKLPQASAGSDADLIARGEIPAP